MNNERDALYQILQQANEDRKRRNFNYFMDELEKDLIADLDQKYLSGDTAKYDSLIKNLKDRGCRIFRNPDGKHKIRFI